MAYYSFDGYHFDGNEKDTIFKPNAHLYADPKQGFSAELYNYYISKRDYESAGRYSLMFSLDGENSINNSSRRYRIYNMMRQGRKRNALLGRLGDTERDEIDLYESFTNPEALASLDPKNAALDKFNKYKLAFIYGQDVSLFDNVKSPKTVEITFDSDQHKFLWWDIDSDNSFRSFLQRSGYNKETLTQKGVKIDPNNGKTKLTFDYDSPFTNELLYNLSKHSTDVGLYDNPIDVKGFDENGNILKAENNESYRPPSYLPLQLTSSDSFLSNARGALGNFISSLKSKKEKIYEKDAKHIYSSTIFGDVTDKVSYLRQMYNATPADNSELRTKIKQQIDLELAPVKNFISNMGFANYKIYSDAYDDDLILREVTDDNIQQVRDVILKSLNDSEIFPSLGEMGGKYGTFITVPYKTYKTGEENLNHRTITYFIEGLFGTEAQKKADSDSRFRAMRELDDIDAYNYSYPLQDGTNIVPVREYKGNNGDYDVKYVLSDGNNATPIDKTIASRIIENEFLREDFFYALYDNFHDNEGNIITTTNKGADIFEAARLGALKIVNNLYKEAPPVSLEDFTPETQNFDNVPDKVRDKIKEAMELYFEVLEKLKVKK